MLMKPGDGDSSPPPRAPGLGGSRDNNLQVLRDAHRFFVEAYRKLGPVFRARFGGEDFTIIAGDEAFEHFRDHGEEGLDRSRFFARYAEAMGDPRFVLREPLGSQEHVRNGLKLAFSRQVCAPFVPRLGELARNHFSALPKGKPLRAADVLKPLLIRQLGLVLADADLGPLERDARRFVNISMAVGGHALPGIAMKLPAYQRARARLVKALGELVAERRSRPRQQHQSYTILDAMLETRDGQGNGPGAAELTGCLLHGLVGTLFYTYRILAFLLYDAIKHPGVMEKARAESDGLFAGDGPTLEKLRPLQYIKAVYDESLRLHPISIGLPYDVKEPVRVANTQLHPGDQVLFSAFCSHFSERHYKTPYAFDPERCMPPRNEQKARGAHVPFGFGPRVCTARGFVDTIAMLNLAAIASFAEWELSPRDYEMHVIPAPLPGPSPGFRVRALSARTPPAAGPARANDVPPDALTTVLPPVDNELLSSIMSLVETRTYQPRSLIIKQGDEADCFYILVDGQVEVFREEGKGRESLLARLNNGAYFGEIGLLRGIPRTATVKAWERGPVKVLAIERDAFLKIVSRSDLVSDEIARLVRQRYLTTTLAQAMPGLTAKRAGRLAGDVTLKSYAPEEPVVRQGEPADAFYVIGKGSAEVYRRMEDGEQHHLATLAAGQFFGEAGLLQRTPRNASVHAGPDGVECLVIPATAFYQLVKDTPEALNDLVMAMCTRVVAGLESSGK
ncbi:MAG: hypothetical protein GMKNLPBB_01797 [Myxococcota bacterium]|nr:hypothetical protein [Myxococcota bacterium]